MNKLILVAIVFISTAFCCMTQPLENFKVAIQAGDAGQKKYLSISQKKAFSREEAKTHKDVIDFALIMSKDGNEKTTAWYNLSGKDSKVPAELTGTATGINAISIDRDQFEKCNSTADLQRMTGHITNNSFSFYATISNKASEAVLYPCFIFQWPNGQRGLIWVDADGEDTFTVHVKGMQ